MARPIDTIVRVACMAALAVPAAASAYAVHVETSSSASTGGNHAGSGGVVQTGASEASVQTVTTVHGGYATSTVEIATSQDGTIHHEEQTIVQPADHAVVTAAAKASGNPAATSIMISTEGVPLGGKAITKTSAGTSSAASSTALHAESTTTAAFAEPSLALRVFSSIRLLFGNLLGWLW